MIRRTIRSLRTQPRRRGWPTPSILLAGAAVFIVLGGSAAAARGLIRAGDIAPGAVTSKAIGNGAVEPRDLSTSTRALLADGQGVSGAEGDTGPTGSAGAKGETGSAGTTGVRGENGVPGSPGSNGASGANGPNGANGTNGIDGAVGPQGVEGAKGATGAQGAQGPQGTAGTNGTITPFSAKQGLTVLPTSAPTAPATTVVELAVPAGNYVISAKTQLYQSGAGDSVECSLKSGSTILDQTAMKTLPALASVPASLQAVTTVTTSPTTLSVQCKVSVADGTANYNSLIAIPTA
jgi:Collagen triple helix repeat (20 copies)